MDMTVIRHTTSSYDIDAIIEALKKDMVKTKVGDPVPTFASWSAHFYRS